MIYGDRLARNSAAPALGSVPLTERVKRPRIAEAPVCASTSAVQKAHQVWLSMGIDHLLDRPGGDTDQCVFVLNLDPLLMLTRSTQAMFLPIL